MPKSQSASNVPKTPPAPGYLAPLFLFLFIATSTSLQYIIPALTHSCGFTFVAHINLFQVLVTLALLHCGNALSCFAFDFRLSRAKILRFFPLALAFTGMVYTGVAPMIAQTVSLNATVKKLTVVPTMALSFWLLRERPTLADLLTTALTVFGIGLACFKEVAAEPAAMRLALLNTLFSAAFHIYARMFCRQASPFEVMLFSNSLSLPFFALGAMLETACYGPWPVFAFRARFFWPLFALSSSMGFFFNAFNFNANRLNSSTTLVVVADLKNTAVLLWDMYSDPRNRVGKPATYFWGIGLAALGSVLFSAFKLAETAKRRREKAK